MDASARRGSATLVPAADGGRDNTLFGADHHFGDINSVADFHQAVPVRDYEALTPYINKVVAGQPDVLWPGQPLYLAKTSGTTSGTKYIPITQDSIPNHINSARDALLNYIHQTGNSAFLDKKLIFLSGSPRIRRESGHQNRAAVGHCQSSRSCLPPHKSATGLRNEHNRRLGNQTRPHYRRDHSPADVAYFGDSALGADVFRPDSGPHGEEN